MSSDNSAYESTYVLAALLLSVLLILIAIAKMYSTPCSKNERFDAIYPNSTRVREPDHVGMNQLKRPTLEESEYTNSLEHDNGPVNELLPVTGADESTYEFSPQDLTDINFLDTSERIGQDTISNSLKNANYSIRPDPPIAKTQVSPWMNSEIDADPLRNDKALM